MEPIECPGVYIDERVQSERWIDRASLDSPAVREEPESLLSDVRLLLDVCKQIYICSSGTLFATKLVELSESAINDCTPIFAFFDISFDGDEPSRVRRNLSRSSWPDRDQTPSPSTAASIRHGFAFASQSEESYGLQLLSGVSTDIQVRDAPNLIVPVAILRPPTAVRTAFPADVGTSDQSDVSIEQWRRQQQQQQQQQQHHCHILFAEPRHICKCLDAGAVDVLSSPLDRSRIHGLLVHAYRTRRTAQKELSKFLAKRKLRKQSWVGVHDGQPYAYLREAMVSKLMQGICKPEEVIDEFQWRELDISAERAAFVREQIGVWSFTAHHFSDDELVFGACEMLQHAFSMPGVDHWRLTTGELLTFLLACRAAYNSFVLYHNFRHAIDVLQSLFCFLLHIGALPPYGSIPYPANQSPIASLISPFDALTLLISAIGHDVGHPGVNNFFLVKLDAPLAQLYNDNSVLEAFHCAAFSQILRRHWPAAFKDNELRKLLISSILATDMGVHQKFMERLGNLQTKYHSNADSFDGWKPQDLAQYRTLLCGLLIKCADISNVARPWDVAERWTKILQEEFANQGEMEKEVGMETTLFGGPPELGNVFKLATGQIGFMSIFALPLFEGVADLLPQLSFTVDQIRSNQSMWRSLADGDLRQKGALRVDTLTEGHISPRTRSPTRKGTAGVAQIQFQSQSQSSVDKVGSSEGYFDSADISSVEQDDIGREKYESPHSSVGSVLRTLSRENLNLQFNVISPVVSPDSQATSMGMPNCEPVSRKASSPVADVALVGVSQISESDAADATGAAGAAGATAATYPPGEVCSNGNCGSHVNQPLSSSISYGSQSRSDSHLPGPLQDESNGDGDSSPSSPQTSGGGDGRTHSDSTYSNVVMTPVSSATNMTSLDARSDARSVEAAGSGGRPTGHRSRPSSSAAAHNSHSAANPRLRRGYGNSGSTGDIRSMRHIEDFDKDRILATIIGRNRNRSRSPAHSAATVSAAGSLKGEEHSVGDAHDHLALETSPRRLLKRRSRLRLAFWKRKSHHSHQPELSSEI